jgi:hypothetical protein
MFLWSQHFLKEIDSYHLDKLSRDICINVQVE